MNGVNENNYSIKIKFIEKGIEVECGNISDAILLLNLGDKKSILTKDNEEDSQKVRKSKSKNKREAWTDDEIRFILENPHISNAELSKSEKLISRHNIRSVKMMIYRLRTESHDLKPETKELIAEYKNLGEGKVEKNTAKIENDESGEKDNPEDEDSKFKRIFDKL